eukprot:TRINITY_DN3244_c0_g1_i1.p2 TRINITY_DN3244_c0_g1~~TRINITY_DN3244_c0_g1_i1.p2  ORF type:complete len:315 (+),score=90.02 TRINITY_DN3244_c0_g1_i1:159-1103(+)
MSLRTTLSARVDAASAAAAQPAAAPRPAAGPAAEGEAGAGRSEGLLAGLMRRFMPQRSSAKPRAARAARPERAARPDRSDRPAAPERPQLRVSCPGCEVTLGIGSGVDLEGGASVRCGRCGCPFRPVASPGRAPARARRSILSCSGCGTLLDAPPGAHVQCSICRRVTTRPAADAPAPPQPHRHALGGGPLLSRHQRGDPLVLAQLTDLFHLFAQGQHGPAAASSDGATAASINRLPTRPLTKGDLGRDGGECLICLEAWEEEAEVRTLPCFHFFHTHCVDQWLGRHANCPSCKTSIIGGPSDAELELGGGSAP